MIRKPTTKFMPCVYPIPGKKLAILLRMFSNSFLLLIGS